MFLNRWRAQYPFAMKLGSSILLLSVMILLLLPSNNLDSFRTSSFTFIAFFLVFEYISLESHAKGAMQAPYPNFDGNIAYAAVTTIVFVWLICVSYIPELTVQVVVLSLASIPLRLVYEKNSVGLKICFYILIPLSFMYYAFQNKGENRFLLLWPLLVAQICDWAGFIIGNLVKKAGLKTHRLTEISPSKTWEGTAAAVILSVCAGIWAFAEHSLVMGLITALIAVISITGDLYESYLKRRVFVKDAGYILFDHGGMLDRCDSWLFAAYTIPILMFLSQMGLV